MNNHDTLELHELSADDASLRQLLVQGVRAYNTSIAGEAQAQALTVIAKDAAGEVVAGVAGRTIYQHFLIEVVWVAAAYRRTGLGRRLMQRAEQIARQRQCVAAQVDTLSFQGPAFYASLGFEIVGEIDNFPTGHKRYFLLKKYQN